MEMYLLTPLFVVIMLTIIIFLIGSMLSHNESKFRDYDER